MTQRRKLRFRMGDGHIKLVMGGVSRCGNAASQLLSSVREVVISCSLIRHGCSYHYDHVARAEAAINLSTHHHPGDFGNENAAFNMIKLSGAAPAGRFDCSFNLIKADQEAGAADITSPSSHHHLLLQRKSKVTKVYANSLIGVGVASSLYHTSRGDARKIFRWGDYAMISTSALCLTKALSSKHESNQHHVLMIASMLLLPFKPSVVTIVHTGLTEVTFFRRVRATTNTPLQRAHKLHAMSSMLGVALFMADGMLPDIPFIHAAWHLAAALGVATYNKLLE